MPFGRTRGDVVFDVINVFVVALITLTMIYPMWYIIIVSIATPEEAGAGRDLPVAGNHIL